MFDKVRHPLNARHWNMKSITAYVLFGAIILVFALFGIANPDRYGSSSATGGAAAVVNETPITMQEYRQRVEMVESRMGIPVEKLPAEQREMFTKQIQQRALEEMIVSEVIYQNANKQGVAAPDGEVRDELTGITAFQDKGRFQRALYDNYLERSAQTSDDFEREIRKSLVSRRIQNIFEVAATPSSAEVNQLSELNSKQASLRYLEITPAKLNAEKAVTDSEISGYLADASHADAIKKYYDQHALDYRLAEKVHARHILLMVDEKHPAADVLEKVKKIRADLTVKNFASVAEKESQDPGSAKKGGDLGTFEKGRMVPEFEKAAFELKPGVISDPVKTNYGYHIILVEEHQSGRTIGLDEAKSGIARKLLAEKRAPELMEGIKKAVASGHVSDVDAMAKKMGLSWEKADNVTLFGGQIPKVRDPHDILLALAKLNGKTGLIPNLVGSADTQFVVDVSGWKSNPKPSDRDQLQKSVAYQSSEEIFGGWIRDVESKTAVTRNPRLLER